MLLLIAARDACSKPLIRMCLMCIWINFMDTTGIAECVSVTGVHTDAQTHTPQSRSFAEVHMRHNAVTGNLYKTGLFSCICDITSRGPNQYH